MPILIRADGAGYSHTLIAAMSAQGLDFSVGYPVTDAVRAAISAVPKWMWQTACNADGGLREHADVVEVTGLLDLSRWTASCPGMRVIVRRELPHPGATLDAFEIRDGFRYQAFTTNTGRGQTAFLEARHRAHARVEDRIAHRQGHRQGHRPGPPALPTRGHQRRLGRAVADRRGPARAGPDDAADRSARPAPGRTQDPALPTAPHRRPHHPRTTPRVPTPRSALALDPRARPSIPAPTAHPAPGLTAQHHPRPAPAPKITETPDTGPAPRHALTQTMIIKPK